MTLTRFGTSETRQNANSGAERADLSGERSPARRTFEACSAWNSGRAAASGSRVMVVAQPSSRFRRLNGAGKTTAAVSLLPGALGIREFVNADEIARGLSILNRRGEAPP